MSTFRGEGTPAAGTDMYDQADLDAAVAAAAASEAAAGVSETNSAASAAAASSSESNAATSETNAAASEAAAATSESNAATSETNAATSETNAAADAVSTAADAVSTAADAAAAAASLAAASLPATLTGQALKYLRVNAGETAYEQYDLLGSANTFTAAQTISGAILNLTSADGTAGATLRAMQRGGTTKWSDYISGSAGSYAYNLLNDSASAILTIYQDAKALLLTSGGITYDGQSIARVGTTNTFTAAQQFQGGIGINCNASGAQQAYLPGDTKIYEYNTSGVAYLTATQYGGSGNNINLYLRTYSVGSANNAIYAAHNCKTLNLGASVYAWDGETQTTFHGRVNSTGTAVRLPSGWTCSRLSLGTYRVTHNLANTNLSPTVTPYNNTADGARVQTIAANYVDINIYSAGALADSYFHFQLQMW